MTSLLLFASALAYLSAPRSPAAVQQVAGEVIFMAKGNLTSDDPRDQRGGPAQSHLVKLKAGQAYTIDMVSNECDSYLRLLDPRGAELAEDDDSGGMLNAQIVFNCTKDGEYKIVCTTFAANMAGNYTLTVKKRALVALPVSGHALMIGKAAPELKADFALNGPAGKLADRRGKVVLLYFWEMRSSASKNLLPVLNDWSKAYKADGLNVVGVTFYPSDINQKLGLDTTTGKLTRVPAADRQSDRLLLKAFAEHHKLGDHVLFLLAKEDSVAGFDAFAVNSLPQMVLIDRKGIVRMIDLGGTANKTDVENELKKLLAEK